MSCADKKLEGRERTVSSRPFRESDRSICSWATDDLSDSSSAVLDLRDACLAALGNERGRRAKGGSCKSGAGGRDEKRHENLTWPCRGTTSSLL